MDASVYVLCCGRGNEGQLEPDDGEGLIAAVPLSYDNYVVPRGYAEVGVDVFGTNPSTGCGDMGGIDEGVANASTSSCWGQSTAVDSACRWGEVAPGDSSNRQWARPCPVPPGMPPH